MGGGRDESVPPRRAYFAPLCESPTAPWMAASQLKVGRTGTTGALSAGAVSVGAVGGSVNRSSSTDAFCMIALGVEVPVMPVVTAGAPESSTVPPVGGGPDPGPGSSATTATTTGCGARLE